MQTLGDLLRSNTEIAERIHADDFSDFFHVVTCRDQIFAGIDVRTVIAKGSKTAGRRHAVDLLRAFLARRLDDRALVVPRTMESSSIITIRLPRTTSAMGSA